MIDSNFRLHSVQECMYQQYVCICISSTYKREAIKGSKEVTMIQDFKKSENMEKTEDQKVTSTSFVFGIRQDLTYIIS